MPQVPRCAGRKTEGVLSMTDVQKQKGISFTKHDIVILFNVVLSAAIYSFGMNYFVKSGNLFPGGYGGIARLLSEVFNHFFHLDISFSIIYFILNIITVVLLWRHIGHKFMIYSVVFITITSILTAVIPVRMITDDILLISVFGGVISGFATGFVLRNNASSGGTDFIAIWMSSKYNKPTWNYIMAGNAVILTLAGILFGWDKALYSIIYQYVSTQIVNLLHQRYKFSRLDIITNSPDQVCDAIFSVAHHGITKLKCEGGFSHKERWMLIVTVNTYELQDILRSIKKADPHAFITIGSVGRIIGNYHQTPLE